MIFRGEKSYSGKIIYKVGCVFPMVIVSILPHAEFGPNDHREDAPHFITRHTIVWIPRDFLNSRMNVPE